MSGCLLCLWISTILLKILPTWLHNYIDMPRPRRVQVLRLPRARQQVRKLRGGILKITLLKLHRLSHGEADSTLHCVVKIGADLYVNKCQNIGYYHGRSAEGRRGGRRGGGRRGER